MTVADRILAFNRSLKIDVQLPAGVKVLNPFLDNDTFKLSTTFYRKFYNDDQPRTIIMGINPGRLGGGLTGIPFTDPNKLESYCGIPNALPKKSELSADFIYQMIHAYGGPEKFYSQFYIGAVCPLGFTKDGKNLNYYDLSDLQNSVTDFIIESLQLQIDLAGNTQVCYCLGEGKNFAFLTRLNKQHDFFKEITPLAHPRFIMQYRRKKIDDFIQIYLQEFNRHSTH